MKPRSDRPRLFAVCGRPVSHSLSQQLFAAAFRASGLPHIYLRLAANNAAHALDLSRRMGISGLNVTAPFKMDMARLLGLAGPASLNTVKMSRGRWRGVSTDEEGVIQALRRAGVEPRGLRAVVLGANPSLSSAVDNDNPARSMGLAQELLALARPGDVWLGISTSGRAQNVCHAASVAAALGLTTIALTGPVGEPLADQVDIPIRAPGARTDRVQECHIQIYHALAEMLEAHFFAGT